MNIKTKKALDKYIKEHGNVVVYFYAGWCKPCEDAGRFLRAAEPFLRKMLNLKIVKLNTDKILWEELNAMEASTLPDVRLYHAGKLVTNRTGLVIYDMEENK